jgi:N-acetylneuraminic acid mutarotase
MLIRFTRKTFLALVAVAGLATSSGASSADHDKNTRWQTIDPQGQATQRHENGMVAHKGKIYVIGGRGVKPVEVFDPNTKTWTKKANTPIEMHHITPVSFGDSILVVTGLTGKYPAELPLQKVWQYTPESDTWQALEQIPKLRQRGGAGVTVYQNHIYIVGGIKLGHTSGTNNLFDRYNPQDKSWITLTDAPHIRDHGNAVVVGDVLVALGGRNTSYHEPERFTAFFEQVSDKVDVYDFASEQWGTLKSRLPLGTAGAGAAVVNNTLYYVGGEYAAKLANNRTFSLDLATQTWTELAQLQRGRHGTNAVVIDNKIYMAMGSGNKGGRPELNSIEVFEVE